VPCRVFDLPNLIALGDYDAARHPLLLFRDLGSFAFSVTLGVHVQWDAWRSARE